MLGIIVVQGILGLRVVVLMIAVIFVVVLLGLTSGRERQKQDKASLYPDHAFDVYVYLSRGRIAKASRSAGVIVRLLGRGAILAAQEGHHRRHPRGLALGSSIAPVVPPVAG